uniref:Uncharacterized protein n=2 Tax=Macrostomum lignano TaxID=282301 RepID=A0A1I8GCW9_9PLAT
MNSQLHQDQQNVVGPLQHGGAATFQAAVFDRVAASATLRRSRQPSRLPEELQSRHRAFSTLQSLVGVILALLGFVALAWGQSASPLGVAVGVWAGPGFLFAGQLGCQAGRSGNGGRSRRAALRWSLSSLGACFASFSIGIAAVVVRAQRISLPPAPVAVSDCVNLSLVCFGLCMSIAQAAFAYLSVWHCYWNCYCEVAKTSSHQQQASLPVAAQQTCSKCLKQQQEHQQQRTSWTTDDLQDRRITPPPSYEEWRSMTLGPGCAGSDSASVHSSPECRSMIVPGEKPRGRKKNLRVHWELELKHVRDPVTGRCVACEALNKSGGLDLAYHPDYGLNTGSGLMVQQNQNRPTTPVIFDPSDPNYIRAIRRGSVALSKGQGVYTHGANPQQFDQPSPTLMKRQSQPQILLLDTQSAPQQQPNYRFVQPSPSGSNNKVVLWQQAASGRVEPQPQYSMATVAGAAMKQPRPPPPQTVWVQPSGGGGANLHGANFYPG